jgi:hypothetical protein
LRYIVQRSILFKCMLTTGWRRAGAATSVFAMTIGPSVTPISLAFNEYHAALLLA